MCNDTDLTIVGTVRFEGDVGRCLVRLEGRTASDCQVVEQVELVARSFDLWDAYTDGAPDAADCLAFPSPPRGIGALLLRGGADEELELVHESPGQGVALKIADPCSNLLTMRLTRAR